MGRASGPASDKEEGCCRMGLQLRGKRRDPISGISRQWEQPKSLFYQEKASLPPLFLSAAVRLSCGMEWVCLWMRHCVTGYMTFLPQACSQVWGSRMETNIFIYAHTKTHWVRFHLENPLGAHVQRAFSSQSCFYGGPFVFMNSYLKRSLHPSFSTSNEITEFISFLWDGEKKRLGCHFTLKCCDTV